MKTFVKPVLNVFLLLLMVALLAVILTGESTERTSKTSVCANCLAHRRTVSRKIMWRAMEDRDTIYPLPDNEKVDCQHDWIPLGGGSTFGLGGQSAWTGRSNDPRFTKRNTAIKEYEQRTGRRYADELRMIQEADRQASKQLGRGTP